MVDTYNIERLARESASQSISSYRELESTITMLAERTEMLQARIAAIEESPAFKALNLITS